MAGHHHRSTNKNSHKAFKSRHATKNETRNASKGKTNKSTDSSSIKASQTPYISNKADRKNAARLAQLNKRTVLTTSNRLFSGGNAAPKIVTIVQLTTNISVTNVIERLSEHAGAKKISMNTYECGQRKHRVQFLTPGRELLSVLDASRIADFVVFVLSGIEEADPLGELMIRSVESQGVSNTIALAQDLDSMQSVKSKGDVKRSLLSYMQHFFPTEERIFDLCSAQDMIHIMRHVNSKSPRGIKWRDERPYMLAESVLWAEETSDLAIEGVLRGSGLQVNRLVHLPGYGDFRIAKIRTISSNEARYSLDWETNNECKMETASAADKLIIPNETQDTLEEFVTADSEMPEVNNGMGNENTKGVRLDEHFYFDAATPDDEPKAIPHGTSAYQASWIVDGDVNSEADPEFETESHEDANAEAEEPQSKILHSSDGDDFNEMMLDMSPEEEVAEAESYRARLHERKEDLDFPDEIELPMDISARECLKKYRGLRDFRTSTWDVDEFDPDAPKDFRRLSRIPNFKATHHQIVNESTNVDAVAGTRVQIFIENGPKELALSWEPSQCLAVYGLLRTEHQLAALNFSITPNTEYEQPVRSNDEMIIQCGPRRFVANPIFSAYSESGNGLRKYEKFIQRGRTSIAALVGPITFGSVPTLYFKRTSDGLALIGSGSFLDVNHRHAIIKRIVLTGHPYKIHKKLVTVRFMFFNAEDVNWFKAVRLFTKHRRLGFIKESLGTHGYFKATFDGVIRPDDTVALQLYKRIYPRMISAIC